MHAKIGVMTADLMCRSHVGGTHQTVKKRAGSKSARVSFLATPCSTLKGQLNEVG